MMSSFFVTSQHIPSFEYAFFLLVWVLLLYEQFKPLPPEIYEYLSTITGVKQMKWFLSLTRCHFQPRVTEGHECTVACMLELSQRLPKFCVTFLPWAIFLANIANFLRPKFGGHKRLNIAIPC